MNKIKDKFSLLRFNKSEFIKHSITLFTGFIIAQSLSVLLYPVFSRLYSPEQFGTFALFTSITGIIALLSSFTYEQAIMLPHDEKKALALVILALFITLIQCFIIFLIFLFCRHYIAIKILNNAKIEPFLILVIISVILNNLYTTFTYYANRKKFYASIAQSSINQGIGVNISKLIFGLLQYYNSGLIIGRIIGQLTSAVQLTAQVIKKVSLKRHDFFHAIGVVKEAAVEFKNFPLFRMPHTIMNTFSTALPIFVLNKYFTVHDAGQYTLATGVLLTPVLLIVSSVSKVINQKIIEKIHNKVPVFNEVIRMLRIMMPVVGVLFILFFFFSEIVFVFLFGKEWQDAGKIAGIILPWVFLVLFVSPFSFIPDIFFRQRKAMLIDMGYLFLRIISMATGVYFKNYQLAVLLFVVSGCIVLSYCLLWYLSLLKKHEKLMSKL
jgi:O-antigen/teichoic acid export membrane protein